MTDKQARFCEEYMIDLNATQAAIRAGYSPKTAQEQSARLLSNLWFKIVLPSCRPSKAVGPAYLLIVSCGNLPRLLLQTPAT